MFVSKLMLQALLAELDRRGIQSSNLVPELAPDGEGSHHFTALRGREVELLVERAIASSKDPGLGLTLGQQVPESMLHVLGHLLLTCGTLREAFDVVRQYAGLLMGGVEWYLSERDGTATFGFARPNLSAETARFWADWVLTLALRVGRHHSGQPSGAPHALLLAHAAPSYAERYRHVFGCTVQFDQPTYGIVFPRELLDVRQPHADARLTAVLKETADVLQREATNSSSYSERVRYALRYERDLVNVDFDDLASRWGMTRRTLRRRLSAEGNSFSELLDEACCRIAQEQLRDPQGSIKEIAERLGYSEASAFFRAFKRWTGQTPSAYRTRALSERVAHSA
jgi:AraC-like DNA-binding protein